MNIGDKLNIVGRVENQGLSFNLELEVIKLGVIGTALLINPLNYDLFVLNFITGQLTTTLDNGFYSDCFDLFNITTNTHII